MKNILLLGGARRVTLAEQLRGILAEQVRFFSFEKDNGFYPISSIAEVIAAPKFNSSDFDIFLEKFLIENKCTVLGCMDSAIPSIAKIAGHNYGGGKVIGPKIEGALISLNKKSTADFCEKQKIRHPKIFSSQNLLPVTVIAKPVEGFGGKGIHVFNPGEHESLAGLWQTHIVQELIVGQETTHDLYITNDFQVYASSRDRLAVIDGEVDHCIVRLPEVDEMDLFNRIAASRLFIGPLTIQTFRTNSNEVVLIEINARFGGGVTASIAAGFPGMELFAFESFGISIPHRAFKPLEMKRARRDFYRFIDQY